MSANGMLHLRPLLQARFKVPDILILGTQLLAESIPRGSYLLVHLESGWIKICSGIGQKSQGQCQGTFKLSAIRVQEETTINKAKH